MAYSEFLWHLEADPGMRTSLDITAFSPTSEALTCFRPSEVSLDRTKFPEWLEADNS